MSRLFFVYYFFEFTELDRRLSLLIWMAIMISLIVTFTLPRMSGIRTLVASVLLRMIFSFGVRPTLFILGCTTVSSALPLFVCWKEAGQQKSLEESHSLFRVGSTLCWPFMFSWNMNQIQNGLFHSLVRYHGLSWLSPLLISRRWSCSIFQFMHINVFL